MSIRNTSYCSEAVGCSSQNVQRKRGHTVDAQFLHQVSLHMSWHILLLYIGLCCVQYIRNVFHAIICFYRFVFLLFSMSPSISTQIPIPVYITLGKIRKTPLRTMPSGAGNTGFYTSSFRYTSLYYILLYILRRRSHNTL